MQSAVGMADLIRTIQPASLVMPRKTRRRDDEEGTSDFSRWMSGEDGVNDAPAPKSPLLQRPMTSLEDMLLLQRARDQIDRATAKPAAPAAAAILSYKENSEESETPLLFEDENQHVFEFISKDTPGVRVNKEI